MQVYGFTLAKEKIIVTYKQRKLVNADWHLAKVETTRDLVIQRL